MRHHQPTSHGNGLRNVDEPQLQIVKGKAYLLTRNRATYKYDRKLVGELCRQGELVSLYKHERERDRFHKTDAWGINYELFQLVTGTINIKSEAGIYRIDKRTAEIWHRVMHFKQQNLELQCFIPVSKFTFTPHT